MSLFKYIFTLFIILNSMCSLEYAKPEIYLIPENYKGEIIVYFYQKQIAEQQYEGDKLLFEINDEGHGFSPIPPNKGVQPQSNITFYYVNAKGERMLIPHFKEEGLQAKDIVASDIYGFKSNFHFFIDERQKIHTYPNPSFSPSQLEQWKLEQEEGGNKDNDRGR